MTQDKSFFLNQLTAEDAQTLSRLMIDNQERFARFFPMTLAQNQSEEASKAYILLKNIEFEYKSEFTFALRKSVDGTVCGLVIIKNIDREKSRAEIAYCIGEKYAGRGWTSRAVTQISQFAFQKLQLKTLEILSHESNYASIRVAEKCGFIHTKVLKAEHTPPNEKPLDMQLFELSREQ